VWQLLRTQVLALWGALSETGVILPALFLFVWQVRAEDILCHATCARVELLGVPSNDAPRR